MNQPVYDQIGKSYNTNRRADARLVERIIGLLDLPAGAVLADIGAGTGNYAGAIADQGFKVQAVEPSAEMRGQAKPHEGVTWIAGSAENIPLPNASVDGIVVILAIHHFASIGEAARELGRICPTGPIVILTNDPRVAEPSWFADYFPEIHARDFITFPPLAEITDQISGALGRAGGVHGFPLPDNFTDRNMLSGWNRPESYLDAQVRQNTSGFAMAEPEIVKLRIAKLEQDLQSGEWDRKHGALRTQSAFDAGFRLLRFGAR